MQDEEYRAYVKRQSYDDLLSISRSLDKISQPDRYAMVMTEIAERDKRPETAPAQAKVEAKRTKTLTIVLGLFFLGNGVILLFTGHDSIVSITEQPVVYWVVVVAYLLGAMACILPNVIKNRTRTNNKQLTEQSASGPAQRRS